MSRTVWRLIGSTNRVIECSVKRSPAAAYTVVVMMGRETFLYETYPDERSATVRTVQIREGLLKGGGWAVVADLPTPGVPANTPHAP